MKILWFDTETTGLSCVKNDIITIAGLVEIDGEVKEEFYFKCQPRDWETVSEEALKVNGITKEELRKFDDPDVVYVKLCKIFGKYVNKFNKADKFIPAGHNVGFDVDFLFKFFEKSGDKYCGSWLDYHKLDMIPLLQILSLKGAIKLDNFKLETASKHFGVAIEAHDALSDIKATRAIAKQLLGGLVWSPAMQESKKESNEKIQ